MKFKTIYTFLTCCIASFLLINQAQAQCCHAPDSLKVKSVTDSSFCVQWRVNDSLHCDSAKAFQIQFRISGTTAWTTKTRLYLASDSLFTFCDTGTACATYQWRVRNVCLHNGDTLITAYISGPNFTLLCPSPKAGGHNQSLIQAHSISIAPNPAKSTILITGIYSKAIRIDIMNMNGKRVYTQNVTPQQGKVSVPVNISSFDKGIYFVNISDGISAAKTNFIKE